MKQKNHQMKPIAFAVLAAALFALNAPFSKLLLSNISPTMLAALLYLGAGIGIGITNGISKIFQKTESEQKLTKRDLPYSVLMIVLDIAAPILLMFGLTYTTAENVSLLSNFEIVSTSVIAQFVFQEKISRRLWIAISLVTVSSLILSFENANSLSFSFGSLFVVLSCVCWGAENNCTKMLSSKNPFQIVIIKGLFSGMGSLIIALFIGERFPSLFYSTMALSLGFVTYGLSISFYIYAQRYLGAVKTSTYYELAPFIGAFLSISISREIPSILFFVALMIMATGTYFISFDIMRSDNIMRENKDISFDRRADK